MFAAKNKVRVIYAGGTIGMLPGEQGLEPGSNFASRLLALIDKNWFEALGCELSFFEYNPPLDSSAMNASHWFNLAAQILTEQDQYDSFLILQGTDTLAWTASALECLLGSRLSSPLVLTASQLPLGSPNSDALTNFQFACEALTQLNKGCFIAFAKQLLPATSTRKLDTQAFNAFAAISQPSSKTFHWPLNGQLTTAELLHLASHFKPNLLRLPLIPSLNDAWLSQQLEGLDGLILEGLGSGNTPPLPLTFQRLATLHQKCVLPVGLISQCWQGGVSYKYAASSSLQKAGVLALATMTPEYAEVRLVCLLALRQLNKISAKEVVSFWLAT